MSSDLDFSTVIASAVHDMKNSLGMLLHSVEEVSDAIPEETRTSSAFTTLQYEAQRLHGDLIQLLGIYKMEQQTLSARVDEHFVPDFLDEQYARHKPLLEGLGIEMAVDAEPVTGYFDDNLVAGVLTNIINNAIRYTKNTLRLAAREEDGYLVIAVEDDGGGYPAHMINAPEQFSREGVDFSSGSTHLGLYFAHRIAGMHQEGERTGFIQLSNGGQTGGGVFELHLP